MKQKFNLMPAIMTVLSALYFVYVIMSEDTILAADAIGGDPGGKILPAFMALFMFLGFLYLTLKEKPDGEPMDPGTKKLFFITLVMSVLYVLLIRHIGFIILSTILLYGLEYIYATVGEKRNTKELLGGGAITIVITTVLFIIMRTITKTLMSLGRDGALPSIFTVATFEAAISAVFVILAAVLVNKTLCKSMKAKGLNRASSAGILTLTTVLLLYIVFKQFFSVNLAPGILDIYRRSL